MAKLFYWDSVECLRERNDGYAYGIGNTKEEVIEAIMETPWNEELRQELLSTEPKVFDSFPVGFAILGCL